MGVEGTIEIINPVASTPGDGQGADLGKSVERVEGLQVGLLDNSMPHAGDYLGHVGEALARRHGVRLFTRRKGWAARSAGAEVLDEIAANCDVAVTGFGV